MNMTGVLKSLMEEQSKLKAKNAFILSTLQDHNKVTFSSDVKNIDIVSVKDILVKKLLEYREVKNYATIEKQEEEINVVKLQSNYNECQKTVVKLFEEIKRKLLMITEAFSSGNTKNYVILQELIAQYSLLLPQMCGLIAEKTKKIRKLQKIKKTMIRNKRLMGESKDVEYMKLKSRKQQVEKQFSQMKQMINLRKYKLDEIIIQLGKMKNKNNAFFKKNKILCKKLELKMEMIHKSNGIINTLKKSISLMRKEVIALEKKVGLLAYPDVAEDSKVVSERNSQLKELLDQSQAQYAKNVSPHRKQHQ